MLFGTLIETKMPNERVATRSSTNNMADSLATGTTEPSKLTMDQTNMDSIGTSSSTTLPDANIPPTTTSPNDVPMKTNDVVVLATPHDSPATDLTLKNQQSPMIQGDAMDAIKKALGELATSFKTSNAEMKDDFGKLRSEISNDLQTHITSYDDKLETMESKMLEQHDIKYYEIEELLTNHKLQMSSDLEAHKLQISSDFNDFKDLHHSTDSDSKAFKDLQETVKSQQTKIMTMERDMLIKDQRLEYIANRLDTHISTTNNRFLRVQEGVDANRLLVNEVESHGRRWAIRIFGLQVPKDAIETKEEAKEKVVNFLSEYLGIHVAVGDIDCAHRIGAVKNGAQIILTRFFRRDITDHIMKCKKMLKGKPLVVHEDTTVLNRVLINDLNKRAEVESVWTQSGKVWIKLVGSNKKMKININDNLDFKLRLNPSTEATTQSTVPQEEATVPQDEATATISTISSSTLTTDTPTIVVAGSSTATAQYAIQFPAITESPTTTTQSMVTSTSTTIESTSHPTDVTVLTQVSTPPIMTTLPSAAHVRNILARGQNTSPTPSLPPYTAFSTEGPIPLPQAIEA